jgi:hypothetical protein
MQQDEIDGLIMDTTVQFVRLSHAAVLMAVTRNVGIPLGVSFGPKESFEIYDRFYTLFDEHGVDLRGYILFSDQGAALRSIDKGRRRHLFCLHRALKSFGKGCGRSAPLVGNPVQARSQKELDVFTEVYTPDSLQVCEDHGHEEEQLKRCLEKVGLMMAEDGIAFAGPDWTRWCQVSMLERLETKMPRTSNAIECLNGHMNERTPRNNTLWGSLPRIGAIFTRKIAGFGACLRHNIQESASIALSAGPCLGRGSDVLRDRFFQIS